MSGNRRGGFAVAALAPGGLALVLFGLLAGCGAAENDVATPADGPAGSATAAPPPEGAAGAGGSGGTAGSGGASALERCHAEELDIALGASDTIESGQRTARLSFTNRAARSCQLYGYPGVQLVTEAGATFDLRRSPVVEPTVIVLDPGESAGATLTYARPDRPEDAFPAASLRVTPPDERTTVTLPWTNGDVLEQDGATRPASYVGALTP